MTMTMTLEEEEKFLIDKLLSARHAIELNKKAKRELVAKGSQLEKELADIEQAAIDYMLGNGIKETSGLSISETYSVDVPDVDAMPEEFVRVKTVREPNKNLIRELKPQGNWYSIKQGYKLTYKGD